MNTNKKIFVIGGDMRLKKAAQDLIERGFSVRTFATFDCTDNKVPSLITGLKWADVVLLGLPVSTDNETIFAPSYNEKISFSLIAENMTQGAILLGGLIPSDLCDKLTLRGIKCIDYFLREELAILNAVPTAEGAIEILMSELPTTICGSRFLITGFGKIAKCLAKMLTGIGAEVCIAARSHRDNAWAKALGYEHIHICNMYDKVCSFDAVINTVPAKVIDRQVLSNMKSDTLVIDLASKPGGVDMASAGEIGRKVIWALSLPGKVAPVTAGLIISATVINIINETDFEDAD